MFWIGFVIGFVIGLTCGSVVMLCSDMEETMEDITHANDWIR